jgi:hypothetical protein
VETLKDVAANQVIYVKEGSGITKSQTFSRGT